MEVASYPLVGVVAKEVGCLFVSREDAQNRNLILEQIQQRQQEFLSKVVLAPLVIFPEGTVTSGKHMLKLKKGAFAGLLPVKPVILDSLTNPNFHLSVGAYGILLHLIRFFGYLYHNISLTELPIIRPTEYMFEKWKNLGSEKWEIYAEVVRNIYCEIGGLEKSDMTLRDSYTYDNVLQGIESNRKDSIDPNGKIIK